MDDQLNISATVVPHQLPGSPSGKFDFRVEYEVKIKDDLTGEVVRIKQEQKDIPALGEHSLQATWDGKDENGEFPPDGRYRVEVVTKLVREKRSSGKTKKKNSNTETVQISKGGETALR